MVSFILEIKPSFVTVFGLIEKVNPLTEEACQQQLMIY